MSVLRSKVPERSKAATEQYKRAFRYGFECFKVGETTEPLDLRHSLAVLGLGLNDDEGTRDGVFGRVVEVKVDQRPAAVVAVAVMSMIDAANSLRGRFLSFGILGRCGVFSSVVPSPLKDPVFSVA